MNKDNRISNLGRKQYLKSHGLEPFPHAAMPVSQGNEDDDILFLITESGSHNEKINYKNLKASILDNSVMLTGNQLISGEKTFADVCTFQSTIYTNEIIDIVQTGDISGNIFVGQTGLFQKVGIGLDFSDRREMKPVYSDFPDSAEGYISYDFGGGIKTETLSDQNFNFYLTSGDGQDYTFTGDANGKDPSLSVKQGDQLNFINEIGAHPLSIQDYNGNIIAQENQGLTTFNASATGAYFYQCTVVGHQQMSGNILVTKNSFGGIDFNAPGEPNLNTSISSYEIYEPLGYYNSNTPESQLNNDTTNITLDGHLLHPDDVHREMRGAWLEINFEKPFHYKGFSIYRKNIESAAQNLKVVASNDGKSWRTIHKVSGLSQSDYNDENTETSFSLNQYIEDKYSKYRLVGEKTFSKPFWDLGHFSFSGVLIKEFTTIKEPQYTLHVSGESCFIGNTTHTGFARHSGDLYRIGNFTQTGNSFIDGSEKITGNIFLGKTLYHLNDEDTFIEYTDDKIDITAGSGTKIVLNEIEDNKIQFFTNGKEQARIDQSGFFGINTTTPFAELSVTGDAYLECLFTTGLDGQWERVYGGSDETVSFTTELNKGSDSYRINFPKTFGEEPSVTLSLENNEGGPIVPYFISGVNLHEYHINFGSNLLNDGYKIHTSARVTGQSAVHKTRTQSFITEVSGGKDIYEIDFPEPFHTEPVISTAIESKDILIPYLVSGVSKNSYNLIFGQQLPTSCKIHTHAVR